MGLLEIKNKKEFDKLGLKPIKRNLLVLDNLWKKRKSKKIEFYKKPVVGAVAGIYLNDIWVMDLYSIKD